MDEENDLLNGGEALPTMASEAVANAAAPSTDVPIAQRGGLDIAALLQMANTGSQGRAVPSYAADAANVGGRVAKILERNLQEMEADKGFGRIGAALAADIASGGKMPYAVARQQFEGREVGRAVNIANAMTGIAKLGGTDIRALGNLLQRRTEAEARQGNMKAQRINEMVRAAATGFDDSSMAAAHLYGYLAKKQKENPSLDVNELPALMAEAIMDARRNGLTRKVAGRGGRGSGGGGGGGGVPASLPMAADGTPDFDKPFPKPKTDWERFWNMSDKETRKKMFARKQAKAIGEDEGSGGVTVTQGPDGSTTFSFGAGQPAGKAARDKVTTSLNTRLETADRVSAIMNRIRGELDRSGASSIGVLGNISQFTGGLRSQVGEALDSFKDSPDSPTLRRWLGNADAAFSEVFKTGEQRSRAAWLLGDNSEAAQRIRTNVMLLAYAHAKAMDPGGRIARDDVENTLRAIGERGGDPRALRVALDELFADMKAGIESSWLRNKGEEVEYIPGQQIRRKGGSQKAAPAPDLSNMSDEDLDAAAKRALGGGK